MLAACTRRGLKVLSATGAGARADPTRIRVADLRESTNDPLSRAVLLYSYFLFSSFLFNGDFTRASELEKTTYLPWFRFAKLGLVALLILV